MGVEKLGGIGHLASNCDEISAGPRRWPACYGRPSYVVGIRNENSIPREINHGLTLECILLRCNDWRANVIIGSHSLRGAVGAASYIDDEKCQHRPCGAQLFFIDTKHLWR